MVFAWIYHWLPKIISYVSLLQLNFLLDKNGTNNGLSPLTLLDEKCLVLLIHEFINLKLSCDLENGEEFQSLQGLLGGSLELFILPGKHVAVKVELQGWGGEAEAHIRQEVVFMPRHTELWRHSTEQRLE